MEGDIMRSKCDSKMKYFLSLCGSREYTDWEIEKGAYSENLPQARNAPQVESTEDRHKRVVVPELFTPLRDQNEAIERSRLGLRRLLR